MKKIWITGSSGQIGTALNEVLNSLEYELINTDKAELDIGIIDDVMNFGIINHPDVIINCAGYTDIELCQENRVEAFRTNAIGARNLSLVASKIKAKFVQISTNDVFDGRDRKAYTEYDAVNPQSIYGLSKLAGENYVKEFTQKHFIIRSNWIYGKNGSNYVNEVLNAIKSNTPIKSVGDYFGAPTSAKELAKFIAYLITTSKYGTYHATCTGICSRYELACEIAKIKNAELKISQICLKDLNRVEALSTFAVLDNFVLSLEHNYNFPSWKEALTHYLQRP